MNVLSLFDGMSCGRIALDRANIQVGKYYASEIDKYAIQVSEDNYSDIVRLGDVTNWRDWSIDWASIDLLIAGSPCQGFSFAGKQLAFDDPRSALFFVFVDIKKHISEARLRAGKTPLKFLLENVRMKKEFLDVISEHVGVEPVCGQVGHAEEVALMVAGEQAKGGRDISSGHTYVCMSCQHKLFGAGIKNISVI